MALFTTLRENWLWTGTESTKWADWGGAQTVRSVGTLDITTTTTATYYGFNSVELFDLANSEITVKIDTAISSTYASAEQEMKVTKDASNTISLNLIVDTGVVYLQAYKTVAGTQTQVGSVAYNHSTMKYWRFRDNGTTTYWEYGADGVTYTTLYSVASPFVMTGLYVDLDAGQRQAEAGGQTVKFGPVNCNPATRVQVINVATENSSTDATTYTTTSRTYEADTWYVASIHHICATAPNTSTYSSSTLSFATSPTIIDTQQDGDSVRKISLWKFKTTSSGLTGTITFAFDGQTQTGFVFSVNKLANVDPTNPFGYVAKATSGATNVSTLSITNGTASDPLNVVYGAFAQPLATTNYTTSSKSSILTSMKSSTSPNMGTAEVNDEATRSTVSFGIGASSTRMYAVAVEIKADTQADITKTAQYAVTGSVDITKTAQYAVIGNVDITKSSQYQVPTDTTITKTNDYDVAFSTTITKGADYVVLGVVDITKSAQYHVSPSALLEGDSTTVGTLAQETVNGVQYLDGNSTLEANGTVTIANRGILSGDSTMSVEGTTNAYVRIQKTFMYKVYTKAGVYITTWNDVVSDFAITEQLNTSGSEVTIDLARQADDFGEGEDVDYRNIVKVYVIDQEAPNGLLKFTGFISRYNAHYNSDTVQVTLLGFGADFHDYIMEDTGATTVVKNSKDPSTMIEEILTDFTARGGTVTYTGPSIDSTATTASYTFQTNIVMEGIDKALQLAPANWYYYIDQANNVLHFHLLSNTPVHTFAIGRDIKSLSIQKNIEDVVNVVYFSGGGDPALYKKYTDSASVTAYGQRAVRYKDSRVTLTATADLLATSTLKGSPEILVEVEIIDSNLNSKGYDLETIKLGDMVKIGSSGIGPSSLYDVGIYDTSPFDYDLGNLSSIVFQITNLSYTGDIVKLSLSTTPPDITKRIEDIKRNLVDLQNDNNPSTPS